MQTQRNLLSSLFLGGLLCIGLIALGALLAEGLLKFRDMERSVVVKGLSEREVPADVAIWPIRFTEVDNELPSLYATLDDKRARIQHFLQQQGFAAEEISVSQPSLVDRQAQGYNDATINQGRYTGAMTVTVYSRQIDKVRAAMGQIGQLGQAGIALTGQDYDSRTQFLFTDLNRLKPEMIAEATQNAREVADKFAQDSQSRLGKIKHASQGQFSIEDRDSNTPHIKKVRIVSTIEYYLGD
ncbi:MAG: SIMPL domain-containing protein [Aeromonadaceae bacterium]|nr:SIMPL domain-containing protein [Aeromonadaceae bacterium]